MATKTKNNETISGQSGEMDYYHGTTAADSILVTNVTVVAGGSVPVPDYWEPYTVNGGVLIYEGNDANDTMNAQNLKIEGGVFQYIGGEQNDKLSVNGANVSGGSLKVNGGWDEDSISASNITITGGNVSVYGDTGKDTVSVSKVSVTGGTFKQRDHGRSNVNTASEVTISGGHFELSTGIKERVGNDPLDANSVVESVGGSNTLSASKISMTGSYSSLSVYNEGPNNSVSVSDVTLSGGHASIYGVKGNDTISVKKILTNQYNYLDIHAQEKSNSIAVSNSTFAGGYGASIYAEGGNNTVSFANNSVTGEEIKIWGGTDADKFSVSDVTISGGTVSLNGKGGNDNFTVDNVSMTGGNIYVIGGNGNANVSVTNIDKTGGYFDIDMGDGKESVIGNDTIYVENISNAERAYFDIYARGGADFIAIKNSSSVKGYFRAWGGDGKDTISVENVSVTGYYSGSSISGGADDDFISVKSSGVNIYGEDGKDTIVADGYSGNIYAGAGNDSVSVSKLTEGINNNFQGGAGNDTIEFYETWMSYYNSYSGGGDVSGDEGDDLITARNATVYGTGFFGGEGNDTISVHDSTITSGAHFYNGAGNDSVSVSNITGNFSGDVHFGSEYSTYASDGNDTISLDNWTLTGDDSQRILINGSIFSVNNSSINGADSISIKNIIAPNAIFYVYGKGGNDTVSFENMTLGGLGTSYGSTNVRNGIIYGNFDSGNDSISVSNIEFYKGSSSQVSLNGGAGADTISVDGVTLGSEEDGRYTQSHLTVTGGADADNISVSNVSVTGSYSKGYIEGGADADKISVTDSHGLQITGGDGNDTIYFGGAVEATLTDLSTGDAISLSGEYSQAYYKSDKNIFIYGTGVKVSLGGISDVSTLSNVKIYNGSQQRTFGNFVTVLEWKLENGVASYGDLITISGLSSVASWSNITVDGKAINTMDEEEILASGEPVVISQNALDSSKVIEITNGYTLALGTDVETSEEIAEHWEVSNGNAAYFERELSAGYVLSNNQIYYQSEMPVSPMVEVSGLSNSATLDDVSLNKKIVTISANALDKDNTVEISSGYTLALDTDVTISATTPAGWSISSGTALYKTENITEGYTLSDNQISYVDEIVSETLVTVSGLKSTATAKNLSLDTSTNTVSIAAAAVQGEVSITDGYALEMGKGTYSKTTVTGGNGDDTIFSAGSKLAINGGAGDDFVSLASGTSGNTLIGGAGDDSISTAKGKNIYQYADGDGNDVIEGFSETDSLQITSGEIDSWQVVDGDLIFTIGNGSITIKDGANKKINIAIGKNKNVVNIYTAEGILNDKQTNITLRADSESYTVPTKPAIKVVDGSLTNGVEVTGSTAANSIIGGAGNDTLSGGTKGNDSIYGGAGADLINGNAGNDKLIGDAGDDTLSGGVGNDTLTGGDGADLFVYSGGNDVFTDYAEDDKISIANGEISSVGVSGKDVTLKIGKGSIKIKSGVGQKVSLNDEVFIFEKGVTYNEDKTFATLTAAANLASSVNTVDGSAMAAALKFSSNDSDNSIIGGKGADSILGNGGNDSIFGNAGNDKLFGNAGNDVVDGGAGNDSLYGGEGTNTLTGGVGNDIFIYEGGNDLITDYEVGKDKISLSTEITNAKVNGEDLIFETADGNITVTGGADQKITTVTKIGSKTTTQNQFYTALGTYNDKQTEVTLNVDVESYEVPLKPAIKVVDGSLTNGVEIIGNKNADKITGGNGKDTLNGGAGNDSIYGGAGADLIYGDAGNDKLIGDAGDDTLSGGAGNDTLTGGDGADLFVYSGGNDVFTDYAEDDKISIANGEISSVAISGKDITLKIGKGSIKIKSGVGQKVSLNDDVFIFEKGVTYNEDKTFATLTAAANLASSVNTVEGSAMSAALKFSANDSDNSIIGGKGADSILGNGGNDSINGNAGNDKLFGNAGNDVVDGGAGNDSLYGGEGNDTLTGGDGKDVFIFESGNDFIEDYSSKDDKIKFVEEITNTSVSGNDVIFETANGNITVKDGASQKIAYIDFKNKSAIYSAESARTLDLLYDNNFMTDELALDDISEQKFEIQNIETQNNLELSQPVITYSEDK